MEIKLIIECKVIQNLFSEGERTEENSQSLLPQMKVLRSQGRKLYIRSINFQMEFYEIHFLLNFL